MKMGTKLVVGSVLALLLLAVGLYGLVGMRDAHEPPAISETAAR